MCDMPARLVTLLLLGLLAGCSAPVDPDATSGQDLSRSPGAEEPGCEPTVGPSARDYLSVLDPLESRVRAYVMGPESGTLPVVDEASRPTIRIAEGRYEAGGQALLRIDVATPNPDAQTIFGLLDLSGGELYVVRAFEDDSVGLVVGPGVFDAKATREALRGVVESFMLGPGSAQLSVVAESDATRILRTKKAPDGTPLFRVDVQLPNADTSVQYALLNPSRGTFYFVRGEAGSEHALVTGGCRTP